MSDEELDDMARRLVERLTPIAQYEETRVRRTNRLRQAEERRKKALGLLCEVCGLQLSRHSLTDDCFRRAS